MTARTDDELDQLFTEFYEDRNKASPQPLTAWITTYPDLSDTFTLWASDAAILDIAPQRAATPEFAARSLEIGASVLERLRPIAVPARPIVSLNDAARNCGSKPRAVAEAVGIGMILFAKLNRRLIDAVTVPARLVERLADSLRVSKAELSEYLALPPTLAEGAAYRAAGTPEAVGGQPFADALRESTDMTPDQKKQWQSL